MKHLYQEQPLQFGEVHSSAAKQNMHAQEVACCPRKEKQPSTNPYSATLEINASSQWDLVRPVDC